MKKTATNRGYGNCVPPTLQHLKIYFAQKGLPDKTAEGFFYYYQARKWKTESGCPIRNWKTVANNWIWLHQQANKPQTIEIKIRLQLAGQHTAIYER